MSSSFERHIERVTYVSLAMDVTLSGACHLLSFYVDDQLPFLLRSPNILRCQLT